MAKNGVPISAGVFDSFDFKGDEELIIKELLNGSGNIFSGINLGSIIDHTEEGKAILKEISGLKVDIKKTITKGGNVPKAPEVEKIINNIAIKVKEILIDNGFGVNGKLCPIADKIVNGVSYRTFIYWVLKILGSTGFNTKDVVPVDVPNKTGNDIYDVLRDPSLTTFLIVLKAYNVIKLSSNEGNEFEHGLEEELKVCNIGDVSSDIITRLGSYGAKEVFRGTVQDIYYDYPDKSNNLRNKGGIKSSFRIRKKTPEGSTESKFYYTIKREVPEEEKPELIRQGKIRDRKVETRICKEYEYEIDQKDLTAAINRFGLNEFKGKEKYRQSFVISEEGKEKDGIKFDLDKYAGKQHMIEVEASMSQSIQEWLEKLGIDDDSKFPRMATGSSAFMRNIDTDE